MSSLFHSFTHFIRTLIKNILLQIISFVIIICFIGITYAAYTSLTVGEVATGQPVTQALMTKIKDNLDDLNTRVGLVSIPAGAIMAFNLGACPSGWTAANGTLGTPDLRGEFIRGLDSGRGVDVGRVLGTWQTDVLGSHTHSFASQTWGGATTTPVGVSGNQSGTDGNLDGSTHVTGYDRATVPLIINSAGGAETRPRNIALLYCMKQ